MHIQKIAIQELCLLPDSHDADAQQLDTYDNGPAPDDSHTDDCNDDHDNGFSSHPW